MASTGTNQGAADRDINGSQGTFVMMLLVGTSTSWNVAATGRTLGFAADLVADEAVHASYSRTAVDNFVSVPNDTEGRSEWSFDPVDFGALAAAVGQIRAAVIVRVVTNDADSPVHAILDLSSLNYTPGGEGTIIAAGSEGAVQTYTHIPA